MDCWIKNEDREAMKKNASAVSVISGADGPTSVFIAKISLSRKNMAILVVAPLEIRS